jgi:hypothetical protein
MNKALRVFADSMDRFPNLVDISFNVFLVMTEVRKATLLEPANFCHNPHQWRELKAWIAGVVCASDDLIMLDEKLPAGCQMAAGQLPDANRLLVCHARHKIEAEAAILDHEMAMGQILGFHRPGHLECPWGLSFYIQLGEKKGQFYCESCLEEPDPRFIVDSLEKFSDAAKLVGGKITYGIRYHPPNAVWIEKLVEPDVEFCVKHMDALANAIWNNSMPVTADIIWSTIDEAKDSAEKAKDADEQAKGAEPADAEQDKDSPLVKLIRSHHKFWRFLIIQQDHMHYELYVDDETMAQIEETLYAEQCKSTKALGINSDPLTERYINTYVKFTHQIGFMKACIREWL